VHPVRIASSGPEGLTLEASDPSLLPPGGRRAGLLAHDYGPQLVPIACRQFTGWLDVEEGTGRGLYAPHTETGFATPSNKTLVLVASGLMAKRGLRKAERSGVMDRLRAPSA
jgi:hypothetical protein